SMGNTHSRNGRASSRYRLAARLLCSTALMSGAWVRAQTTAPPPPQPRPPLSAVNAQPIGPPSVTASSLSQDGQPAPRPTQGGRRGEVFSPLPTADAVPRVIPLEPPSGPSGPPSEPPRPRVIQLPIDSAGLVPEHPMGQSPRRSDQQVAKDVSNLIETVN